MSATIVTLVEGHSEVRGVPIVLRRLLARLERPDVQVARPFRVKRTRVLREHELERAVIQASRSRAGAAGILLILDADDDCPVALARPLRSRCGATTELPSEVVIANRELEAWFLGAKSSLRGICGIRESAATPPDPEAIRGAKERLTANMTGDRRYVEVDDQPSLAAAFDLDDATASCPSFAKLRRAVATLAEAITAPDRSR